MNWIPFIRSTDPMTPELKTLLRSRMNELVHGAEAAFRPAILAIYGSKANGRPVHIGSAVRLNINGAELLLTAAHVVDENAHTTLYIGGAERLEMIEAEFLVTQAPFGRDRDHYDIAFCRIPTDLLVKLDGRSIGIDEIATSSPAEPGAYYTAIGFPNSKNRRYNPVKNSVRTTLFSYSNVHKLDQKIAEKLPGAGRHHLFMPYDKKSRDDEGRVVDSTALKGMSGGAVVDSGRPSDPRVFSGQEQPKPLLAGIVIELKKSRTLLSVRMEVIMPVLLKHFPSSAAAAVGSGG